jgi:hypothetical protein
MRTDAWSVGVGSAAIQPHEKRYQLVHSTGGFTANHAADKSATRAAFWAPLDQLIRAVSSPG